jgi:hypothetical protein
MKRSWVTRIEVMSAGAPNPGVWVCITREKPKSHRGRVYRGDRISVASVLRAQRAQLILANQERES